MKRRARQRRRMILKLEQHANRAQFSSLIPSVMRTPLLLLPLLAAVHGAVLVAVSPLQGSYLGGTQLTLYGAGFARGGMAVRMEAGCRTETFTRTQSPTDHSTPPPLCPPNPSVVAVCPPFSGTNNSIRREQHLRAGV